MKTVYTFLVLLAFTTIAFTSCKNDDDGTPSPPGDEFVIDGDTYDLGNGYLEYYGENGNGSHDFDVTLVSSTIQYSSSNGTYFGTGNVLYLDLNTSSANGLISGTYAFASDRDAFTFVDGVVGFGTTIGANGDLTGGTFFTIAGGSIDITVNGNETTLEFDLTTDTNKKVIGQFTGVLSII